MTLHARTPKRGSEALSAAPGASGVLIGDLSSISQTKRLAEDANHASGPGGFDVVVHNAGVGFNNPYTTTPPSSSSSDAEEGKGGLATEFAVNTLAPYILTSLMHRPRIRLVYLSSGLHQDGDPSLRDVAWLERRGKGWIGRLAYSDTKLQDVMLAFAVARLWTGSYGVQSHACTPGWVRTRMGGEGAPGDADEGAKTQTFLAGASKDEDLGSGRYWVGGKVGTPHVAAGDVEKQEELLRVCGELSGVKFPR